MIIGAIVQARMGSQRLPGKVLTKIGSELVLERIVNRLRLCTGLAAIVVATTELQNDDRIRDWCVRNRVECFRGSEEDVLDRYYRAAKKYNFSAVVRITADCPLIDPLVVDKLISLFRIQKPDAISLAGSFPDGLDCQIFSLNALEKAWLKAELKSDREHVGTYIEKTNRQEFNIIGVELFENLGHHRWTLDEKADFEFLTKLLEGLEKEKKVFYSDDIIEYLNQNTHILNINAHILRNDGYFRSVADEKK